MIARMALRRRARFFAPPGFRLTPRSSRHRVASFRQWFLFSTDQWPRAISASRWWLASASARLVMKWRVSLLKSAVLFLSRYQRVRLTSCRAPGNRAASKSNEATRNSRHSMRPCSHSVSEVQSAGRPSSFSRASWWRVGWLSLRAWKWSPPAVVMISAVFFGHGARRWSRRRWAGLRRLAGGGLGRRAVRSRPWLRCRWPWPAGLRCGGGTR
jgi:hypothetical protein